MYFEQLAQEFADWIINHVEPEWDEDVIDQIYRQLLLFPQLPAESAERKQHRIISFRPEFDTDDAWEVTNRYVDWALEWLRHVCRDVRVREQIVDAGWARAQSDWDKLDSRARRSKIQSIHLSYFQ